MLIEFKVFNYRSIGEEQTFSLIPNLAYDEHNENIIDFHGHSVLNAAAIYGNNGSGKSNLLSAMALLDKLVHLSARTSSTTPLPYDPFLLKKEFSDKPTKFEIIFVTEGNRYKYGIEFLAKKVIRSGYIKR